jgi:transcriptional regulator with XRE-family HTH domain
MAEETDQVLDAVGPRLRALRKQRGLTLADLSAATGTSESTLSRLESGGRRPTLELLLPLARVYGDGPVSPSQSSIATRRIPTLTWPFGSHGRGAALREQGSTIPM